MTLAGYACALHRQCLNESFEDGIWKLVAFAARYGHQRIPDLLAMTKSDLNKFVEKLAEIMSEEKDAMARAFEGG
jgi:hypothetical protein